MSLDDIAAGLSVTTEQADAGVAVVDDTAGDLAERLRAVEDALPTDAETAATLVRAYAGGASVGAAAREAALPRVTAAKTLHRCGERVAPLSPAGMDVVADWVAGRLSRTEAMALADAGADAFALAAYVLTHDPVPAARDAVEGALAPNETGAAALDGMDGALETPDDLR